MENVYFFAKTIFGYGDTFWPMASPLASLAGWIKKC